MKTNTEEIQNSKTRSKYRHVWKALSFSLLMLVGSFCQGQSLQYSWAKNLGGSSNDYGRAITTDASGNVYTTGAFASTNADFDPDISSSTSIASNGSFDVYVSKLDANGDYVWAKTFGGSGSDYGNSIATDNAGNVYVTGRYNGTVDFDPGSSTHNLTSAGSNDIFISKLDALGNFLWTRSIGSTANDEGNSIRIDGSGNVLVTGYFTGTVDFDPGKGVKNLTSTSASYDVFVLKLTAAGTYVWAKSFGGSSNDQAYDMELDNAGSVYLTGSFRNTVDFDPGSGTANLSSVNGAQDVFVTKLNANGLYIWAKGFGGTGDDVGYALSLDVAGNVLITGEFSETANFNPGSGTHNMTAYGSADGFVSKLNASGNFVWARKLGGTQWDKAYGIETDASGNVYVTGEFRGIADFDPGSGDTKDTSLGNVEMFMVNLDASGNHIWSERYGRNLEDKGIKMHMDGSGSLLVTGHFMVSVFFNPPSTTQYVSSKGWADVFVFKLSCAATQGTHTVTACKSYFFNGVTYTSSNNTAKDTLTNSAGCDSIVTLDLTINTLDVSTTAAGNTIMANLSGATYQWIDCDKNNTPIPGETGSSYTAVKNGNYAVIITFKGCTDTSDCVTINSVGVDDLLTSLEMLEVYPNPSSGNVSVTFKDVQESIELALYAMDGKLIEHYGVHKSTKQIDLSIKALPGIYLMELVNEKGLKSVQRLIVE